MESGGLRGTRVFLYAPRLSGGFQANINVMVHSLGVMTEEEYLALSRLQMKQMSGRSEPDVDMPAPHGHSGRIVEWHAHMGPMHIKTRQLIVVCGSSAFVVSATALSTQFSEYREEFEAAMDSFRLEAPINPSGQPNAL